MSSSWLVLFQFHTQECTYTNSHLVNWKLYLWHFKHAEALSGLKESRFWFTQQFGLMIINQDKTFTLQNALSSFAKLWIAVYRHQSTFWFGKTREHTPPPHIHNHNHHHHTHRRASPDWFRYEISKRPWEPTDSQVASCFSCNKQNPWETLLSFDGGQHTASSLKSHIP